MEITPLVYETTKANILRGLHPVVRSFVNDYFEFLRKLDAYDVVDAIEKNETVKNKYESLGVSPERMTIAMGRGFLKVSPRYREQAKKAVNLDVAKWTLQFENPVVYQVIEQYGDRGWDWLKRNLEDFRKIVGLD